jgi:hypothetical protein
MNNLVLITSIVCTPNLPLSYIKTRSVFTHEQRFEQTKKTIETVRDKIPNVKIIMVECSILTETQNDYFMKNVDYFINLIDNDALRQNIYSQSKSLGEGTMTMSAINYMKNNNIEYDNLFKITGRYWLSESYNYENFNNNDIVVNYINGNDNNVCTSLYKLNKTNVDDFHAFLIENMKNMYECIGYENLFAKFIKKQQTSKVTNLKKIGVNGYISVSNDFADN